ncbi:DUF1641 domain-containing protein [Deinococcus sp. Arct2-2]|uniref:DUF1641 domain-containing protein n=1 Tax=Deinococcus sp. Arct2-2 TaxID=2568653 RepID=UPI0010A2AB5A|nr:DUF1641 domain-containing protein [Deinococcus sp. Arct2-2]THF67797.1 DUF1641 domain-containing protein [Deinococcus sp. Arct2-2]
MAKALEFTPQPPTPQQQLDASVSDSAEALAESLRLLRELHEHGVLDILVRLVRGGEGLSASALNLLAGESSTTLIKNVVELGKTASALNPDEVRVLGQAVSAGVSEGAKYVAQHSGHGRGLGLPELLGLLRDRDVQLALGAVFGVLKGAGRALREAGEE